MHKNVGKDSQGNDSTGSVEELGAKGNGSREI